PTARPPRRTAGRRRSRPGRAAGPRDLRPRPTGRPAVPRRPGRLSGAWRPTLRGTPSTAPRAPDPTEPLMSDRYPVAELTDLPEDLRERILAEQEKAGFVPAVFLMFGRRPAESRAFFVYHDAL